MLRVVWFKRDLRVHDHAPLAAAVASGDAVLPLYIIEPELWRQPEMAGRHFAFLGECLADLDAALARRGARRWEGMMAAPPVPAPAQTGGNVRHDNARRPEPSGGVQVLMGKGHRRNANGEQPAKANLPQKTCAGCGLPFTWRKKWARDWEQVRFCSERCRGAPASAPSLASAKVASPAARG